MERWIRVGCFHYDVRARSPQTRTFVLQFVVIDSCHWFITLLRRVKDLVWDLYEHDVIAGVTA
jgi:hypothetical protein